LLLLPTGVARLANAAFTNWDSKSGKLLLLPTGVARLAIAAFTNWGSKIGNCCFYQLG